MSDLVGNAEDRFSHVPAHLKTAFYLQESLRMYYPAWSNCYRKFPCIADEYYSLITGKHCRIHVSRRHYHQIVRENEQEKAVEQAKTEDHCIQEAVYPLEKAIKKDTNPVYG